MEKFSNSIFLLWGTQIAQLQRRTLAGRLSTGPLLQNLGILESEMVGLCRIMGGILKARYGRICRESSIDVLRVPIELGG
jgi:hypothetical protein